MRLSVTIMAHPHREHFVRELLPQLPGASVVWDRHDERWETGRRSMLDYEPGADWHLVVQDDAVLCRDFLAQVQQALPTAGEGPAAFYMGNTGKFSGLKPAEAVQRARGLGKAWIEAPGPWWGVAVAVRTRDIRDMVAWGDERGEPANYDLRMARYFDSLSRRCMYSVPSLANHRVGEANPSLVSGRGHSRGRVAALWSPRGQDRAWDTGPLKLGGAGPDTYELFASIAIMAHPSRAHYLDTLLEEVGAASVVVDHAGEGVWATALQAWQARNPEALYHVVLQDDAVLCEGFEPQLERVLSDPLACYGLYFGGNIGHLRRRGLWAVQQGHTELEAQRLYWGVGTALPTYLVPDMLRWTTSPERWRGPDRYPDGWRGRRSDTRISRWCMAHGIPVRYPLPSLVNHRVGPSLLGGYRDTPEQRVAWWWKGGPEPWEVQRRKREAAR